MAERFERLFTLPSNLYSKDSPVIVSAGSLLKDTETGKIIAQLKYHSVSSTPIKALKIDIAAYDVSGKEIDGVNDYQYLDLNISNGQEFGSNKAIVLPSTVTRSFSIKNASVVFSDGSTANIVFPIKALPESKTLVSEFKNAELAKQYQLKTNKSASYVPFVLDELWFCACGNWNSNCACTNCRLDREKAIESLNISVLEPEMNTRLQAEKVERIQQQELAEKRAKEEQVIKEKNKKKKVLISILATVAIIVFAGLLYYNSQHKFDDVAGIYALHNLEEAEEAIYDFAEDSIDEYGFNPYSYEITIKGSGKIYGLWFVNDRGTLTPRAATIKSVSEDGVCEIDIKDYPDAEVVYTVNAETGEALYFSDNGDDSLELSYHRITERLANNGYQAYSKKEITNDIAFVQDLFELNSANKILEKYQDATTEDAKYDVKIDGAFCGADGSYQIWELDGIYRIIFEQGIYDTNSEKENLIEALNSVFGKYTYSEKFEAYTWKSEEYNMQIDYWPNEGIYFFRDSQESNSSTKVEDDQGNDSQNNNGGTEKIVGGTEAEIKTIIKILSSDIDQVKETYSYHSNDENEILISGTFAGLDGNYEICFYDDGTIWRVIFERYDEEINSQQVLDNICDYLGDYLEYDAEWNEYEWETDEIELAFYVDERIYFDLP